MLFWVRKGMKDMVFVCFCKGNKKSLCPKVKRMFQDDKEEADTVNEY